jgi:hypothetical protein
MKVRLLSQNIELEQSSELGNPMGPSKPTQSHKSKCYMFWDREILYLIAHICLRKEISEVKILRRTRID